MKVWWFRLIAVSIPLLFFVLLEIGLRVAGYGQSLPLFIENPIAKDYLLPRPDLVRRYFAPGADIPSVTIEANFLRKQKPQNGVRLFVQGGSTAAGFPYGLGASLAGMLDYRIKQSLPNHYVEVVNTSMAAINSYTNMDMVDEIIAQQPDAVLIYMGHNEYLGILGVGSNFSHTQSRAMTLMFLKLKSLRTFQLIQALYNQLTMPSEVDVSSPQASHTMMAQVAKHKNIEVDSDIYRQGLEQFRANLEWILARYQRANIPVYIATLTSNLLDQPPFSSTPLPEDVRRQFDELRQGAKQGKIDQNRLAVLSQRAQVINSAELHYELGRLYYALGKSNLAKQHLVLAKDHDLLRFRAPEEFNSVIIETAAKYRATLVPVQQRFEQRSKFGIVGNNLMLEHLHPNVQGYFLISDAFYQAIEDSKRFSDWQSVDTATAWKQRLLLPSEEYFGFAKVLQLKTDYPFVEQRTPLKLPFPQDWQQQLGYDFFQKKIDWLTMVSRAQQRYMEDNQLAEVLKTQLLLADALPYDATANIKAAELLIAMGQKTTARTYVQRARWTGLDSAHLQLLLKQTQ